MSTQTSSNSTKLELSATRRIIAGIGWGVLWGGGISILLFSVLPIISTMLILVLCGIIVLCITAGIYLYWNAARQPCPKCATVFTAMPNGSRCPNCGQRVRAQDRQMVSVS